MWHEWATTYAMLLYNNIRPHFCFFRGQLLHNCVDPLFLHSWLMLFSLFYLWYCSLIHHYSFLSMIFSSTHLYMGSLINSPITNIHCQSQLHEFVARVLLLFIVMSYFLYRPTLLFLPISYDLNFSISDLPIDSFSITLQDLLLA